MDSETSAIAGAGVYSYSLERDNSGKITSKTETAGGGSIGYAYTYDTLGRLTSVTKDGSVVEEYQYGANGTRTYERNTRRGISGRTLTYSEEDHVLTAGDTTYQFDADGFLATKTSGLQITSYSYSSRGELLKVDLPDGTTIEYVYDPRGRRIAKKVNGVIAEKYLWQGMTRLLAVYDGNDTLQMRFQYADGRMPISMTRLGSTYYLSYDQVGSLRYVFTSSGEVMKQIQYDSFGNILSDSNSYFTMPFGFAGGLYDSQTGLVHFGARDYDPHVARWTAKDPLLFKGGDVNLYGYCLSDPINSIDPNGEFFFLFVAPAAYTAGMALADLSLAAAMSITLQHAMENTSGSSGWRKEVGLDTWEFGKGYWDPSPPDPDEENRRRIEEECYEECMGELGGNPCNQGYSFTNCLKECIKKNGY